MSDVRVENMARVLVEHSAAVKPGDRVFIEATTAAEPLVRAVLRQVLEQGGHPHLLLSLTDQEEIFFQAASDEQLDFVPVFHQLAANEFDARIRIYSEANTRALNNVDPARAARRGKAISAYQSVVIRRGAEGSLRWVSTLYPTLAYAMEASMGWHEYQDFVFRANHADLAITPDPVAYWRDLRDRQQAYVDRIAGHDQVALRGPNVDLTLSIAGRTFLNSSGQHNLPDGEIYTGPVEDSANGWVRFTYPAIFGGRIVEGVELTFENGRVAKATAEKNEAFLLQMLESDAGARYLGEFALGTNFEIDRFTGHILFDEKIGGTFHLALGAGYPETGSVNRSVIHWDMICDMQHDAEILLDGERIYRNGQFELGGAAA